MEESHPVKALEREFQNDLIIRTDGVERGYHHPPPLINSIKVLAVKFRLGAFHVTLYEGGVKGSFEIAISFESYSSWSKHRRVH